jgi:hypothetical protein
MVLTALRPQAQQEWDSGDDFEEEADFDDEHGRGVDTSLGDMGEVCRAPPPPPPPRVVLHQCLPTP